MIPDFDDRGYLPPGIPPATMEEIEARFGLASEIRKVILESIVRTIDLARVAGIQRIVIDGNFTTAKPEPNDADCALMAGPGDIVGDDAMRFHGNKAEKRARISMHPE